MNKDSLGDEKIEFTYLNNSTKWEKQE